MSHIHDCYRALGHAPRRPATHKEGYYLQHEAIELALTGFLASRPYLEAARKLFSMVCCNPSPSYFFRLESVQSIVPELSAHSQNTEEGEALPLPPVDLHELGSNHEIRDALTATAIRIASLKKTHPQDTYRQITSDLRRCSYLPCPLPSAGQPRPLQCGRSSGQH